MKKLLTLVTTLLVTVSLFAQEDMTFQANVTNKNGDVLFIKNGRTIVKEIKADEKGTFKATFPIKEGLYQLFDGAEYAQLFLKPGYDLKMTLDGAKFDETIKFTGKGSNENNFIAAQTLAEQKFDYNGMLALDEAAFNKAFDEKLNGDIARLDKQTGLDANFVTTYKAGISQGLQGLKQYYAQISANKKLNNTKSPGFDFENHKGGKTSLESLKGKFVYIDVWATWCGPCIAEIPALKEVEKEYHGKNIEFVSISIDDKKDHEKWKKMVADKELKGIQLFADNNWESDFVKKYAIDGIPRFILIDTEGKIVNADAPRPSDAKLKELLKEVGL